MVGIGMARQGDPGAGEDGAEDGQGDDEGQSGHEKGEDVAGALARLGAELIPRTKSDPLLHNPIPPLYLETHYNR